MLRSNKGIMDIGSFPELVAEIRRRELNLYRLPTGKLLVTPTSKISDLMPHIGKWKQQLAWLAVPYLAGATGGKIHRMAHPLVPEGYYIAADDAALDGSGLHNGLPVLTYSEWQHLKGSPAHGIALVLFNKTVWGGTVVQSGPLPSDLFNERKYAFYEQPAEPIGE